VIGNADMQLINNNLGKINNIVNQGNREVLIITVQSPQFSLGFSIILIPVRFIEDILVGH
jgi:ribosomal 30S subunit maturation factor RimM